MADKYITTWTGTRWRRQTTVGWSFLVKWGDGSQQWIDLKILKESNPLKVGVYVIACGIQDEPMFAWWVSYVMRKRDIIFSMVKSRVRRTTHKYGIEMPAPGQDTVQNAIDLDHKNGDTFWMDLLAKEMRNLNIVLDSGKCEDCLQRS